MTISSRIMEPSVAVVMPIGIVAACWAAVWARPVPFCCGMGSGKGDALVRARRERVARTFILAKKMNMKMRIGYCGVVLYGMIWYNEEIKIIFSKREEKKTDRPIGRIRVG